MNSPDDIRRRSFLAMLASIPATAFLGCQRPAASVHETACAAFQAAFPSVENKFFTDNQMETLEAATSRLLPSDEDPGAKEAGVIYFIDEQLSLPEFKQHQRLFLLGLRKMDRLAIRINRKPFAQSSADIQDSILGKLQQGVRLNRREDSKNFFTLLLMFTLEGFLCDPVYRGNRNEVGWKFVGFSMKPPRPRCPYHVRRG